MQSPSSGLSAVYELLCQPERQSREKLDRLMNGLTSRQREVTSMRHGLRDGRRMTLREIGRVLGITDERVRQIQVAAELKMAKLLPTLDQKVELESGDGNDESLLALGLPSRAYNALRLLTYRRQVGDPIAWIEDPNFEPHLAKLLELTEEEILSSRNLGPVGLKQIKEKLAENGYSLPKKPIA
jgi:hypothetical protein